MLLLVLGLGADDMVGDTSWVTDLVEDLMDVIADLIIGDDGLLMVAFNLLPVVGDNPMPVAVWFMIAVFGGLLIYLRYYR